MNLGASDGLEGVARFKKKFGAQTATYLRTTYVLPASSWPGFFARNEPAHPR